MLKPSLIFALLGFPSAALAQPISRTCLDFNAAPNATVRQQLTNSLIESEIRADNQRLAAGCPSVLREPFSPYNYTNVQQLAETVCKRDPNRLLDSVAAMAIGPFKPNTTENLDDIDYCR